MRLKLYEKYNDPKVLQRVVDALADGEVVILPTDTVYAICCHGLKERPIERICRLKGIDPRKNNLSIICADLAMVSQYAKMSDDTFKLLKQHLPGPFTFILNTNNRLPRIFKNRKEVGIRIPSHAVVGEIVSLLDAPLMTTSVPYEEDEDLGYLANPELIEEKLGQTVDLVVDGGIGDTEPSTIVDCTGDDPIVVRQGKGWLAE